MFQSFTNHSGEARRPVRPAMRLAKSILEPRLEQCVHERRNPGAGEKNQRTKNQERQENR